ncbi:hypothetical protein [Poriferisphaera sp. WC338]|uniref:hypothetical protein n=1 Tax=Poriferisphaera sp. WC338 TaxID=3425129 RepID=UPI003D817788
MKKLFYTRLTFGFYYLFLGTWIGSIIAIAVAAPATFQTIRSYQAAPGIAPFNASLFQDQWSDIVAGAAVGETIDRLINVHLICAMGLVVTIVILRALTAGHIRRLLSFLRISLLMCVVALLAVHIYLTQPAMHTLRDTMYNPKIEQVERDTARTEFQSIHKLSEQLTGLSALLLTGMLVISPFIYKTEQLALLTLTQSHNQNQET